MLPIVGVFLLFLLANECRAQKEFEFEKDYEPHILAIDGRGYARVPKDPRRKFGMEGNEYKNYLNMMERAIVQQFRKDSNTQVVIYIHGGLVSLKKGLKENKIIVDSMMKDNPHIYPICMNWQSGLPQSYGQHLFQIRQGETHRFWGIWSSPLFLLHDLGRGLVRLPLSLYLQTANDINGVDWMRILNERRQSADTMYQSLKRDTSFKMDIQRGEDRRKKGQRLAHTLPYVIFSPISYGVVLPILDIAGTNSWMNMRRKTRTLFHTQEEFRFSRGQRKNAEYVNSFHSSKGKGAAYEFFFMLDSLNKTTSNRIKVNLIGHSMGSMVANEALVNFPNLKVDTIVFMGAACSVNQMKTSVIPFMERNEKTHFYNLSLNPAAESKETILCLTPGGSLLEWIDNIFEPMASFEDRTFGKYENAILAAPLFPESVRNRALMKTFDFEKNKTVPIKHGQFNDVDKSYTFWRKSFWD